MASRHFGFRFSVPVAAGALAMIVVLSAVTPLEAQGPERQNNSGTPRFYPDDPLWADDDMRDIPPVAKDDLSKSFDFVDNTFGKPGKSRGAALNVNSLGEVPDSSWFTNRLGVRDMTIDEVLRGPDTIDGPAEGAWEVIGHPAAGITPKFAIRDSKGVVFLIKLDPATIPELASSVELISTKIFHAIGYQVPEDFIAYLDPSRIRVASGATIKAESGGERPMMVEDVHRWLKHQARRPDGTIRVLASRWVPGKVVGSFRFTGTRSDDANDIYAHERRRELRGLRVFAAWLNHDDARSLNSIDTYVEDSGRRYIRHYLQDFGSTLGSGSTSAQQPRGGNEYLIEGDKVRKGLLTFGLWQRDWMKVKYPEAPSLGNIESDAFDPIAWKTEYPHPAFDQMDAADAFWAARIVARFTDTMIKAIVEIAQLSDASAAKQLADVINARRDKVVAAWITAVNPVDNFELRRSARGNVLLFDNAAVRLGAAAPGERYRMTWRTLDNMTGAEGEDIEGNESSEPVLRVPDAAFGPRDRSGFRYAIASIVTVHPAFPQWRQPVRVTLRNRDGVLDIVGIDRRAAGQLAPATVTSTR
jgi:hypothetical protein